jgi:anthranilate synthase/indole-3-glycerol phosphate synthase/phosphoribosylanthranilate isomerase
MRPRGITVNKYRPWTLPHLPIFLDSPFATPTMPALDLIDHSPQQPEAAPPLANASKVVIIDNFDSFTWNIYQYFVLEGATVEVYRNDQLTIVELAALHPTQLVISPGPGHPKTDSGISRDAIKHFAGKIPVLGVCMGQ